MNRTLLALYGLKWNPFSYKCRFLKNVWRDSALR